MDVDAVRQPATPPTLSELASSLVSGSSGVSSLSYDYEYDEYDSRERVFLVAAALKRAPNSKTGHQYSILESLEELGRLAETAGLEVVGYTYQMLDELNPRTYVNTGKVGEIAKAIADTGVQTVLFDDELSPGQMRNLERALGKLGVRLCDRTALILDIFSQRARTREGKLQVELAQADYQLPRLTKMWSHLERQGGGGQVKGMGEKQIEVDRRLLRNQAARLRRQLEDIRGHRKGYRDRRAAAPIPVVALVGYTNAGKSSLLNTLTNAGVLAEDQLFATLDPTTRRVLLPGGQEVLFSDTVGFIQRLPTQLIAAIRTMLERGFSVADGAPCTLPPPLLCACMDDSERNANIVAALVEHQVDMNEAHVEDGFTPLMQSVKTGSLSMVGLLLRAGADLRRTCKNGRSALFVAIQLGKTAAARSIVSAMCDAKIDVDELRVDNGRTALMEAASRGQGDVAAVLVEAGADVSLVDDEQRTALMLCLDNGHASKKLFGLLMSEASINRADQAGKTPLEIAISRKSMPVAEMLAADGRYDIGKTFSKTTPLIHAIVNEGGTRLVRKLLDRGASPDEVDPVDGKTPMMYAAELGESQIIHDLVKADANPRLELEGGNGWNALMFAARHGHASAARVLQNAMGIRPPERTRMVVAADGGKNANV